MRGVRLIGVLVGVVTLAGGLAGCGNEPEPGQRPPGPDQTAAAWFRPCPEPASATPSASAPADGMPALTLQCLGRGEPIDLRRAPGVPTVVNVWASWCRPCREELPAFESYAVRAGDRVRVLGVVSGDTRPAALSLAMELKVKFPTYWDEGATLVKGLGRNALPVTVFLAADGRLAHVHQGKALDEQGLEQLVREHLGVTL